MKIGEVAKIKNNGEELNMTSSYGEDKGLMKLSFGMLQILISIGLDYFDAFKIAYRQGGNLR